jgi:hypothetical protein
MTQSQINGQWIIFLHMAQVKTLVLMRAILVIFQLEFQSPLNIELTVLD